MCHDKDPNILKLLANNLILLLGHRQSNGMYAWDVIIPKYVEVHVMIGKD